MSTSTESNRNVMNVKWPGTVDEAQRDALGALILAEVRDRRSEFDGGPEKNDYHKLIRQIVVETDAKRIPTLLNPKSHEQKRARSARPLVDDGKRKTGANV